MEQWLQFILTPLVAVIASSGFWAFLQRRDTKRSQTDRLLLGLAYDKIIAMGVAYIERGWITPDEYDDYRKLLYEPYKALGGNGVTERVVAEVSSLPMRPRAMYAAIIQEAKTRKIENDKSYDEYDAGVLA